MRTRREVHSIDEIEEIGEEESKLQTRRKKDSKGWKTTTLCTDWRKLSGHTQPIVETRELEEIGHLQQLRDSADREEWPHSELRITVPEGKPEITKALYEILKQILEEKQTLSEVGKHSGV